MNEVKELITKAAQADKADDAMKFSQAAQSMRECQINPSARRRSRELSPLASGQLIGDVCGVFRPRAQCGGEFLPDAGRYRPLAGQPRAYPPVVDREQPSHVRLPTRPKKRFASGD